MKVYRFVLFTAMLLYSCPDAASTSGNSKLTVHGQDRDRNILTKRLLRGSVSEEADADDDERATLAATKFLPELKKFRDKVHLQEVGSDGTPIKPLNQFFRSAEFKKWFNAITKDDKAYPTSHYDDLVRLFSPLRLASMINASSSSTDKNVVNMGETLRKEQDIVWRGLRTPKVVFGDVTGDQKGLADLYWSDFVKREEQNGMVMKGSRVADQPTLSRAKTTSLPRYADTK